MGPAEPTENLEIKYYLDAVDQSSQRVRWVLFVLITASVITFVSEWNTSPDGWLKQRIQRSSDTLALKYDAPSTTKPAMTEEQRVATERYYEVNSRAKDEKRLREYRDALEDTYTREAIYITIPIFGIKFDINDLGLIGGFTFTIILAMLRFSLVRDYENLRIAFDVARGRGCHSQCFCMLSMSQVLTIPPHQNTGNGGFWRWLPRTIFALPLLIQLYVNFIDFSSRDVGMILAPQRAQVVLIGEWFFFAFIATLTWQCYVFTYERDRVWRAEARCGPGDRI